MAWKNTNQECDWNCLTCDPMQREYCISITMAITKADEEVVDDLSWVFRMLREFTQRGVITVGEALFVRESLMVD